MAFWRNLVLGLVLASVCVSASAQQAGRRVALVIGNSAYTTQGRLANPGPDSRLVADALRRVGFSVMAVNDAGKQAMERSLRDFSRQADGAEVALVYFAGHGMEAGGVNWLLPIDATLADERDLSFEAINLDTVLATVDRARGLRMVVLDACRNNPFSRSMRRGASSTRSVTRGLADVEVTGTLVFYAARGGTVAQDGAPGGNSPFATAFARRVPEPGVDIRLLVSKVRDDVLAATGRTQEPFSYGSLPGVELALVAGTRTVPLAPPAPQVAPQPSQESIELAVWQGALSANSISGFEDYKRQFPSGRFRVLADQNIAALRARANQVVAPPTSGGTATRPAAPATIVSLAGVWVGDYDRSTRYRATFQQSGSQITGEIVEPIGSSPPTRRAIVRGTLGANGAVSFTKTYDGSGGWSHSVQYTGVLSSDGRTIAGSYRLVGGSGSFTMARDTSW